MTDGTPTTTSLIVAEGTQVQHRAVLQLIRDNLADFEEFGLAAFEMRPRLAGQHGGGDVTYAVLNEEHATLLLTYMRNSPVVKDFKKRLVREFWAMKRSPVSPAALPDRKALARMVIDAEEAREIAEARTLQLEEKVAVDAPKVDYVDRHVAENDDIITIESWGHLFGLTEPTTFQLLRTKKMIYRILIGKRWSKGKARLVEEYEHRAYAPYLEWFDQRPQHDAPRHHNGQVRQTLYVKVFHADALARAVGLLNNAQLELLQGGAA
ncbi:Rha family transcriptional regulator [Nocardia sp. NPDC004711]